MHNAVPITRWFLPTQSSDWFNPLRHETLRPRPVVPTPKRCTAAHHVIARRPRLRRLGCQRLPLCGLAGRGRATPTGLDAQRCDFDRVTPYRMARLRAAWLGFQQKNNATEWTELNAYRAEQGHWLDDYALFMALDACYGQPWTQWPADLAQRIPHALAAAGEDLANEVGFFSFVQWRFGVQWEALRDYAHANGVAIVGDAPIFVAHHSADVWMNAAQYQLDESGEPTVVAGVSAGATPCTAGTPCRQMALRGGKRGCSIC